MGGLFHILNCCCQRRQLKIRKKWKGIGFHWTGALASRSVSWARSPTSCCCWHQRQSQIRNKMKCSVTLIHQSSSWSCQEDNRRIHVSSSCYSLVTHTRNWPSLRVTSNSHHSYVSSCRTNSRLCKRLVRNTETPDYEEYIRNQDPCVFLKFEAYV